MTIDLYNSTSDKRKINKNPSLIASGISVKMLDETSFLNPNLRLSTNLVDSDNGYEILGCNYIYIPRFKRWYFVDDIIMTNGNSCILKCRCDVLKSHAEDINNIKCMLDRAENVNNPYIVDNEVPTNANREITLKKCGKVFSDSSGQAYVLNTTGGV